MLRRSPMFVATPSSRNSDRARRDRATAGPASAPSALQITLARRESKAVLVR